MLRIENLCKSYNKQAKAVDNLSLEVAAGDLYGFIGHNGAGKTTTLRAVAGILAFDSGSIHINGFDAIKEPVAAKKSMAFLPDNPDLYEFLSGIRYLNFIADLYEIPKEERLALTQKYAAAFEIESVLGDAISSYSHGMRQKLALISAFIRRPKLLILDEPFVGLDPKAGFLTKQFLHELCSEGGAVFFSTHVLDVAEKLCNKIAIIQNGSLQACGTTQSIVGDSSLENVFLDLQPPVSSAQEVTP